MKIRKKLIKKALSFSLCGALLFPLAAGVNPQHIFYEDVEAAEAAEALPLLDATLGEFVNTLYFSVGAGIANTDWASLISTSSNATATISQLVQETSEGVWEVTSGGATIISNFVNEATQAGFGPLMDCLETTLSDGAEAMSSVDNIAYTIGGSLTGVGTVAGGTAVLPVIGAVGIGVGLGILADHLCKKFGIGFYNNLPVNDPSLKIDIPAGYSCCATSIYKRGSTINVRTYCASGGIFAIYGNNNVGYTSFAPNTSYLQYFNGELTSSSNNQGSVQIGSLSQQYYTYEGFQNYNGLSLNQIKDGFNNAIYSYNPLSPDVILPNGNATSTYNNGNWEVPGLSPAYDPTTTGLIPIPNQDYQTWRALAQTNTENGLTGNDQSEDYLTFIEPYTIPLPPSINPDPNPDPDPDPDPDPNPNPTGTPVPDPEPVVNPTPIPVPNPNPNPNPGTNPVPGQNTDPNPMITPLPDAEYIPEQSPAPEPTNPTESEAEQLDPGKVPVAGMQGINLKDKFPFCIPWDIAYLFQKLNQTREAPYFEFDINFVGAGGNQKIVIDLRPWDSVATTLRITELILFILGLMIAFKKITFIGEG